MTIQVANTPYSWGIYDTEAPPLPHDQVLDAMRDTGYAGTVLGPWGYYPADVDSLREALNSRDLALVSAELRLNLSDPDTYDQDRSRLLATGQLLAALDAKLLVLIDNIKPDARSTQQMSRVRAPRLSGDRWDDFADTVNQLARTLHDETGLRLAFRHFAGTHVENTNEVDLLMARVDPALVGLCLDTGHWRYAGGDVLQAINSYAGHIWQVYLSDSDPTIRQFSQDEQLTFYEATQAGVLCRLGSGDIDFPAIIKALRETHYDGWLVLEQDSQADDPAAQLIDARANRDFIRNLGL